jgi:AcrR family transcriptional regulator
MGRRKKFENSYEIIVETANQLFGQYGVVRTTMEEIAKAAGLGKATIYSEFASKDHLLVAVVLRFMEGVHHQMRLTAQKADLQKGKTLDILREMLLVQIFSLYDKATSHFHGQDILPMPSALGLNFKIHQKFLDYHQAEYKMIAELLEKAAEQGEIKPADDYLKLARTLREAMTSFYPPIVLMNRPSKEELEKNAHALLDLIFAGLKAGKSA